MSLGNYFGIMSQNGRDTLDHLTHCLCTKYSELYNNCKAYLDLQVDWHDFLCDVASTVSVHEAVITSPVGRAWLNIVSLFPISRQSQFAMLHDIAKVVYKYSRQDY